MPRVSLGFKIWAENTTADPIQVGGGRTYPLFEPTEHPLRIEAVHLRQDFTTQINSLYLFVTRRGAVKLKEEISFPKGSDYPTPIFLPLPPPGAGVWQTTVPLPLQLDQGDQLWVTVHSSLEKDKPERYLYLTCTGVHLPTRVQHRWIKGSSRPYEVPKGRRLVIEHLNGYTVGSTDEDSDIYIVNNRPAATPETYEVYYIPFAPRKGKERRPVNQPARIVAEGPCSLTVGTQEAPEPKDFNIAIWGYEEFIA